MAAIKIFLVNNKRFNCFKKTKIALSYKIKKKMMLVKIKTGWNNKKAIKQNKEISE